VIWSSVPGKRYAVEFKDSIDAPGWRRLPELVTAAGSAASVIDSSPHAFQRYYRAVLAGNLQN
jgi:hypothetical protein